MKNLLLVSWILFSISIQAQKELSLEQAITEAWTTFYPSSIDQLQWVKETKSYSYVEDNKLMIQGLKGEAAAVLTLEELAADADVTMKRFPQIEWLSRYEFKYNTVDGPRLYHLMYNEGKALLETNENSRFGELSPSHDKIAYTVDNNLFVQQGDEHKQVTDNPEHITSGQAYARYEFGIGKGTFWSPNGAMLAFYEKDESNVFDYPLVNYDVKPASVNYIKYPMAGESSEIASVGVYNCESGEVVYLDLEGGKKDDSYYATNLGWGADNKTIYLAIVQRDQKHMWLKEYDAASGKELRTLFEEKHDKYVEPEHAIIPVPNKEQFLWFSERDGFNNLYLYSNDGKLLGNTSFDFPITSFSGFSANGKMAFVQATGERATESHLFRISLPSMNTTQLTHEPGYHTTQVSDDGKMIIDNWTNIHTPRAIDLWSSSGKKLKVLHRAENPLEDYAVSTPELFEMESFDGTPLWCRMIKPSDFDETKKYPVLVYVYNGPHAQMNTNRFLAGAPLWMYHYAEQGNIVFTVDGRGSANRGFDFENAIHRNVGDIEVQDQEFCTNWLKEQPYTDENRFAVHGWSYGGFMTTSMMLKRPGLFEVGVAGGPVIDWQFYEVMYTERYMDTPQTNREGFENTDLRRFVENLEGDLLLIHGVVDDVVVLQHNMSFIKTCVDKGVQVDYFSYPGHPHNVRGIDRVHLMRKVLDYVDTKLND